MLARDEREGLHSRWLMLIIDATDADRQAVFAADRSDHRLLLLRSLATAYLLPVLSDGLWVTSKFSFASEAAHSASMNGGQKD